MPIPSCLRFAPALAAVLLAAACGSAAKPIDATDIAAIEKADAAGLAAINAGNYDAATAGYTADAAVMPPNMPPAVGSAAIKSLWKSMLGGINIKLDMKSEKITGEGRLAYRWGSYHLTATMKDSAQTQIAPEDGKSLRVFAKQDDGSWKIAAESWSSNAEPAPPEPAPVPKKK